METAIQNPFQKPNPFKYNHYEKFTHAILPTSSSMNTSTSALLHESKYYQPPSSSNSNWNFNQNNFEKKVDFSRKQSGHNANPNNFETRMRMKTSYVVPNDKPKIVPTKDAPLENPFLRTSLLMNRQEIKNQVEMDLNLHRYRASSNYEGPPKQLKEPAEIKSIYEGVRLSFGSVPSESAYMIKKDSNTYESKVNPYDNKPNPYERKSNRFDPALIISHYVKDN